jgi:hypothetical protein
MRPPTLASLSLALATLALGALAACSDGSDAVAGPPPNDEPSPLPDGGKPKPKDAGTEPDATPKEAGPAGCQPNALGTVTELATTDRQYGVSRLQAYGGVLYWQTSDSYTLDGSPQVNAYVIAQKRFFSIYGKPTWLNVNARGVYFTDFQLRRYDLAGGSGTAFPTLSGYYPTLRTDGGYQYMVGTAADRSDFELWATDADGQTTGGALQGPFTEYVAADASNVYFVTYSKPLSGPRVTNVARANRALALPSVQFLSEATDQEPTGFAIDDAAFYVATSGIGGSTARCPKTGNGACIDLSPAGGNANLTVTSSYLYFTNASGELFRAKKDASSAPELVFRACGRVVSVAAAGDVVYFIATTPTGKNGISIRSVP